MALQPLAGHMSVCLSVNLSKFCHTRVVSDSVKHLCTRYRSQALDSGARFLGEFPDMTSSIHSNSIIVPSAYIFLVVTSHYSVL